MGRGSDSPRADGFDSVPMGTLDYRTGCAMRTTTTSFAGALGAAALFLAACGGGDAAEGSGDSASGSGGGESRTLRLALTQAEHHPSSRALDALGERLSEATDSRWSIGVFAKEPRGAQAGALQLVSSGAVDMAIVS